MSDARTPERWLPVPGHEATYEVSDHGRVRSLDRLVPSPRGGGLRPVTGRVLSATAAADGYPMVSLWTGGVQTPIKVHHLVAAAFLGPRPAGQVVRHWNDEPTDNRASNLLYGTHGDNYEDAVRNGRRPGPTEICDRGHALVEANIASNRGCKACARARATARYAARQGRELDLQVESDAAYRRIIEGRRRPIVLTR